MARPKKDTLPDIVVASQIFCFVEEGEARGESRAALFAIVRKHFGISDRTIKRRLAVIKKAREHSTLLTDRDCHNS
jgi:hypothetical protein